MAEIDFLDIPVDLRVRAWPLEWVNGSPLDGDGVAAKVAALEAESGVADFGGEGREFFCPSLDIGHDIEGHLTASFADDGIREFVRSLSEFKMATRSFRRRLVVIAAR